MLVILKENVENLGRIGDVVKVADGYARNFLIPGKKVVAANENNLSAIEHQKKMLEKKRSAEKAGAEEIAKKIASFTCNITRKVGEKDKLFGSVTANDIADSLKVGGIEIEKRSIHIKEPIKALGVHNVEVKLLPEVTAQLKVWVVKEGA
ncbi:MAG: 50S ribosomal protein L9 [Bdellovibrionales bacterium]|nr:50S ribosomal protein L9 [Bdellovibrionales bacterium]